MAKNQTPDQDLTVQITLGDRHFALGGCAISPDRARDLFHQLVDVLEEHAHAQDKEA